MKNRKFIFLACAVIFLGLDVAAEDITSRYSMPPVKRAPDGSVADNILKKAKVLEYSKEMPVKYSEVMDTERFVNNLRTSIKNQVTPVGQDYKTVYFGGKTSKQLDNFMKGLASADKIEIILTTRELILDQPINLRSHTIIRGSSTRLIAGKVDIAIIGNGIENAGLKDLTVERPGKCAIMLINASRFIMENVAVLNSNDRGMVIRGQSSFIHVERGRFIGNRRGGIMIQDGSHHVYIAHSEVSGGVSSSNWSAGIVITSVSPVSEYGIRDAFDDNYFFPKDFSFKRESVPYKNIIESSHIHDNKSSGIYLDGGNGNAIMGNYIFNNDKEGVCLDFFSVGNIVELNSIKGNGFRRLQSDDDLRHDSVLHFGRLADGSAVSKLPNISIDNSAYNIIVRNTITGAAGDGIKIVRSGFRNIIGLNSVTDNNADDNSTFTFFGILLGAAGSDVENDTSGIDLLPSIENIVFGNTIYGSHRAGVFIDHGGVYNDIYDNVIMKQKGEPVIQHDHPNSIIGNNFNVKRPILSEILNSKKRLAVVLSMLTFAVLVSTGSLYILFSRYHLKKRKNNAA
jgi:parallel beta-helix repeat protein